MTCILVSLPCIFSPALWWPDHGVAIMKTLSAIWEKSASCDATPKSQILLCARNQLNLRSSWRGKVIDRPESDKGIYAAHHASRAVPSTDPPLIRLFDFSFSYNDEESSKPIMLFWGLDTISLPSSDSLQTSQTWPHYCPIRIVERVVSSLQSR